MIMTRMGHILRSPRTKLVRELRYALTQNGRTGPAAPVRGGSLETAEGDQPASHEPVAGQWESLSKAKWLGVPLSCRAMSRSRYAGSMSGARHAGAASQRVQGDRRDHGLVNSRCYSNNQRDQPGFILPPTGKIHNRHMSDLRTNPRAAQERGKCLCVRGWLTDQGG